jgi:class 3 adenylate cyclase/tetratricopeptide (TPR) repeat protein
MRACPSCGHENEGDARFCSRCGTALAPAEPARETRKVVTVLFCDVVGSTALGESTDPEALRARMRRYFEDLRAIVERHGGVVEKFVGDAVMAVFGIPVSHEDDALRAVRAAAEMRAAIAGHGLEARIGINTGEVVVGGAGETLVTGDAVNVAARLEQSAPPGEALIGAETRRLVRDAVGVARVEPLLLKGKTDPVEAYRLVEMLPESNGIARHLERPLVGRGRERERLWRDFEDAVAGSTCRLFTLLGPAGIGKSRLVADFLERVGVSADVLRGRCLHYGEGITYWPLVEILVRLGIDPNQVIGTAPEETQLSFRRLLETRATERAQVIVIDDLQWAEPVFLDLVEHVADFSRDVPIFLLCVARTELLDLRPGWGGGKVNASSLLLGPLGGEECDVLIENLLGGSELDEEVRRRIAGASEGNPLFVEEMLAMVREGARDDELVVPPTIHALLQARLDLLDADERAVIERGAVEGEVFHRGAVAELAPAPVRPELATHLATLVRKELIRATPPAFPDDDAFRFRHLLIRDAAYESLPKATRAELHERFADWLSDHELVELDEILGYHLEQAHRYRRELDTGDTRLPELAARGHEHLAAGGRAALERGDFGAGLKLLRRAAAIVPDDDPRRHALAPAMGFALEETGHAEEALSLLASVQSTPRQDIRALVTLVHDTLDVFTAGSVTPDVRSRRRSEARQVLEEAGDDEGLGVYWWSVAAEHWLANRAAETLAAGEEGLRYFERAGTRVLWAGDLEHFTQAAYIFGPLPVHEGIARLRTLRASNRGMLAEARSSGVLARLLAMAGDIASARELHKASRETVRQAGMPTMAAAMSTHAGWIEQRAGDYEAWEQALRSGIEELDRLRSDAYFSTAAGDLALCLHLQGRYDEVAALCATIRERSPSADVVNFIFADALEGGVRAHEGRFDEAEELGRRAVEDADETDFVENRAQSRLLLAESLLAAGRAAEASSLAGTALSILDAKGDVTKAARVRERLEQLGLGVA